MSWLSRLFGDDDDDDDDGGDGWCWDCGEMIGTDSDGELLDLTCPCCGAHQDDGP